MASGSATAAKQVHEEVKRQGGLEEKEQCKVDEVQEVGGKVGDLGMDRDMEETLTGLWLLSRGLRWRSRRTGRRMSSCLKARTLQQV
jgi:hypothetical protein